MTLPAKCLQHWKRQPATPWSEAGIAVNNPAYEMKYMDLVDTNNGNVYVTAKSEDGQDATVTVTWPMPTDADENGTFYVVHFKDLDREFEGSEAVSNIENAETEVIQAGGYGGWYPV